MERLIIELEHGISPALANEAADTLMSYVTGFVLQEQMQATGTGPPVPLDELRARFPRVFLGAEGDDERSFRVATTAIIDGFFAQSARTRSTRRSR